MRKQICTAAALLFWVLGCARAPMADDRASDLVLNQDIIREARVRAGLPALESDVRQAATRTLPRSDREPAFEDVDGVIRLLWSSLPEHCFIYPTERYFYYRFQLGARRLSGNLRFTDIERGVMHVGYFDSLEIDEAHSKSYDGASGIQVTDAGDGCYRVRLFGMERTFHIVLNTRARPESLVLAAGEEFVTGVVDESGTPLALLWDDVNGSFLFVVVGELGLPETLVDLGDGLLVGADSRFVFFNQSIEGRDRLVLVGVRKASIRLNDYFDGPFDQVPPDLDLKSKIERAYPYVKLQGGIDTHGNFLNVPGCRVAISPYQEYDSLSTLVQTLAGMRKDGSDEVAIARTLTYETKRDFHLKVAAMGKQPTLGELLGASMVGYGRTGHQLFLSQGWPANHRAEASSTWPSDHLEDGSRKWPPNHQPELSRKNGVDGK